MVPATPPMPVGEPPKRPLLAGRGGSPAGMGPFIRRLDPGDFPAELTGGHTIYADDSGYSLGDPKHPDFPRWC